MTLLQAAVGKWASSALSHGGKVVVAWVISAAIKAPA